MSEKAKIFEAINLSQGFPEFRPPEILLDSIRKQIEFGTHQYEPMPGSYALRHALTEKMQRHYSIESEVDNFCITAGATQAIFTAIQAFVDTGDEVILLDPAYDSYAPSVDLAGGLCIRIPLTGDSFKPNWARIKKKISAKTKLLIINTPHNPTGTRFSEEDRLQLKELCELGDFLILSDEVYEHIVFDGHEHTCLRALEEIADRVMVVNSFGKTYHCTGWKVGYFFASNELCRIFKKVHQFNVFSVNSISQVALAEVLEEDDYVRALSGFYQQKRDLLCELLAPTPFTFTKTQSTFFQLVNYSGLSRSNDLEFSNWLVKEIGIASIPLSPFYENKTRKNFIRLCFAKSNETLMAAGEKLKKLY